MLASLVLSVAVAFSLITTGANAPESIGVVTTQHPTTLKAFTTIGTTLNTTIDSTSAQPGDNFQLTVDDPRFPYLAGAKIAGHLTHIKPSSGVDPASITFLFDTITFVNGMKEPFRGYVLSNRVVNHTAGTPQPAAEAVATPQGQGLFAPSSSTIVWKRNIGGPSGSTYTTNTTAQTGGIGYARKPGVPIHVAEGMQVLLQLASDLKTP